VSSLPKIAALLRAVPPRALSRSGFIDQRKAN
jgi:hypothetical protein